MHGIKRFKDVSHGLPSNARSRSSREIPRDSGWKKKHTITTARLQPPKRKYGPELDLARNKGVEKATSQLMIWDVQ